MLIRLDRTAYWCDHQCKCTTSTEMITDKIELFLRKWSKPTESSWVESNWTELGWTEEEKWNDINWRILWQKNSIWYVWLGNRQPIIFVMYTYIRVKSVTVFISSKRTHHYSSTKEKKVVTSLKIIIASRSFVWVEQRRRKKSLCRFKGWLRCQTGWISMHYALEFIIIHIITRFI